MFVKVCGVTTPGDAVAAVEAGVDAVGLNLVPTSIRYVGLDAARAIRAVVPDEVVVVGIVRDRASTEILEIVAALDLDAVQLHGDEPPEVAAAVAPAVAMMIRAVAVGSPAAEALAGYPADVVLVDGPEPGSGTAYDRRPVGDLVHRHRVLLAGGLGPDDVGAAVRLVRPWGVDVASGVESAPGRKDPHLMARFVTEARTAAHLQA